MQGYADFTLKTFKKMTPKEVALKEVFARVMTLDQAKESYKKWIKNALALGGQSDDVVRFWNEVLLEIDKIESSNSA